MEVGGRVGSLWLHGDDRRGPIEARWRTSKPMSRPAFPPQPSPWSSDRARDRGQERFAGRRVRDLGIEDAGGGVDARGGVGRHLCPPVAIPPLEGQHMPEQLPLPLSWRSWPVRRCEVCGREHKRVDNPICDACRYRASKHPCAIPGCDRLIAPGSTTCLWHRSRQVSKPRPLHTRCTECAAEMAPSPVQVCPTCQEKTYHLCACGCGRYRRKYDRHGYIRLYLTGHNDVWANRHHPLIAC